MVDETFLLVGQSTTLTNRNANAASYWKTLSIANIFGITQSILIRAMLYGYFKVSFIVQ